MRLQGSRYTFILCNECQSQSPPFRVYLYSDDDGEQWQGKLPDGWTTDDEAPLWEDSAIVGGCPLHPCEVGETEEIKGETRDESPIS